MTVVGLGRPFFKGPSHEYKEVFKRGFSWMPIARKDHKCDFCLGVIRKGSDYYKETFTPWSCTDNDIFWTLKAHHECKQSFDQFFAALGSEGWGEEDIREWREWRESSA